MKTLGQLITEELIGRTEVRKQLVLQQSEALQRQYEQQNGVATTPEEVLRRETFAYLVIKGNLERGLYR